MNEYFCLAVFLISPVVKMAINKKIPTNVCPSNVLTSIARIEKTTKIHKFS